MADQSFQPHNSAHERQAVRAGAPRLTALFLDRPHEPDLFVRVVHPATVRARLLFTHASLVHSEYYLPMAIQLAHWGIECWLPDLRGHGRSGGLRGHTRSWSEPVRDVIAAWQAMRAAGPVPLLLAGGESYGALLTYCAIRSGDIEPDGVTLLSPAFGLNYHPSPLVWWSLTKLAWPWAGRFRPLTPLPFSGVTEDPMVRHYIERDRLCNRRYTLGFLLNLMSAQRLVPQPNPDWSTATLLLLSEHDPITDNAVTQSVFAESPDVTCAVCEQGLHSLVADHPDWVVDHLLNWAETVQPARRDSSSDASS